MKTSPDPAPKPPAAKPWSMRRPMALGFTALAVLVLGFGLWGSLSSLSGAVVAPGQIEVEQNRQVVQHPDGGVVASIEVIEGRQVAAGDVLIRLDGALLKTELAIVEGRLSETIAQRARLIAERDGLAAPVFPEALLQEAAERAEVAEQIEGQTSLFTARSAAAAQEKAQLQRQVGQIRARITGFDAQEEAVNIQLRLIR